MLKFKLENPHRRGGEEKSRINVSHRTVFLLFLCRNFECISSYSPEHTERKLRISHQSAPLTVLTTVVSSESLRRVDI